MTNKPASDIWAEKNFDFNKLLEPYAEGGTKDAPVTRTIGTIFDYLINKKRYPVDVAGAAMLITFKELHEGKVFEPDPGKWGSAGRKLVTYIRFKCDDINQQRLKSQVFESIAGARMGAIEEISFEITRGMIPWFIRIMAPKSWRWLRKRKKRKAKDESSQRN